MSTPVDPQLMRAMQLKREAGVKLAIWAVVTLALVAAGGGALALAYMLGGSGSLAATAGALLTVSIFIPMGIMTFELDNPIEEYLYQSRQLSELRNKLAWNAQQEELAWLRNIMKEEGQ